MARPAPAEARPARARRLDRALTRLLRLGGRLLGRPSEGLLHDLTGRKKGGAEGSEPGFGALLVDARRALDEGHFGEALVGFACAAERDPLDPWPWHGRGDAMQLSGRYEDALSAYQQAIARAPELALSWCGVGNALEGLGRLQEAGEAWERALQIDPGVSWAREGLARARGRG